MTFLQERRNPDDRVQRRAATATTASVEPHGFCVRVDDLSRRVRAGTRGEITLLDGVSLSVAPGELVAIVGPSGAGKTTLLDAIAGNTRASGGSVRFDGVDVHANLRKFRGVIGYVPQDDIIHVDLALQHTLRYAARLRLPSSTTRAEIDDAVAGAIDAVGLREHADVRVGSLSGGQRKRASIAVELLTEPRVFFLDEPTSGLDPVASRDVHELIDGLRNHGVTVFLTTHRLEEAEQLCDRVAILNTRLRTSGRPEELRDRFFTKALVVRTAAPLADPERVFSADGVAGWRPDDDGGYLVTVDDVRTAAPQVTRALVAANADVLSIAEAQHSLEDVYLELIDEDVEAAR